MRNVKVVVEYDGTDYFGFQYQPKVPTIQGELEKVLAKIVKEDVRVYGSGRTDTGVHAAGQVIHFHTCGTIPIDRVCAAMNALLPRGIAALEAQEVGPDFHSRYSARSRLYRYDILNRETRSALAGRYSWHVARPLDVDVMHAAAQRMLGVHDFKSFACADNEDQTSVREMMEMSVRREGEYVIMEMRANAFLRSMARVTVGTLCEVALGKRRESDISKILEAKDRRQAGKTAPASGLCLVEVEY